jgi:hypothetical protein
MGIVKWISFPGSMIEDRLGLVAGPSVDAHLTLDV